ncbi:uncharacterized protein LOC119078163 [Bradysia coprophila]|uniref:uncharacterized protein LOC119078163 n=1 Tax=Bradysia coprophila TaxID=38358 RepID=UPI00187DD9AD|nr:uncharacterized protein LOC119078163 [Bradysia coprophila]
MTSKQFNFKFVAALFAYCALVHCDSSFPNTIPRCKYADVKCLQSIMNKVIRTSPEGVPEIGLGSIDPLYIGKTVMEQGAPTSPVNVRIRMKNATMSGIRNFDVNKVIGFERNPNTSRFEIHGFVNKVTVLGNYQMSGKALVVPVNGHGAANITFIDTAVKMKFLTHTERRKDEDYVVLDQVVYNSISKRMSMNFENLFNDRLISENMNNFFNENQDILYKELGPALDKVFGNIIKKKMEPIFQKFAYREFFSDYRQEVKKMLRIRTISVSIIIVAFTSIFVICDKLPDSIKKCHPGDTECIAIACNHILHNVTNDFEIISIDPFHIPILRLAPDLTRPVNIDFNITNIEMYGLHKFNIYKISGFTQNINGANEIHLKGNRLNLIGKYILHGQVLILPVVGNGDANVTIINPDIQLKFTGKPSVVDGKTYMQTEDMKVSFNVKKLVFQFDNLYNGDKILGATTLRFVNEYWRDIYLDIKPALVRTFEEEIQKIANDAMAKLPFDEYFLK